MSGLFGVLLFALAIAALVLVTVFILVPLMKGLAWLIGNLFKGIGWIIQHIFGFIFGMIGDAIRAVGSILALIVLAPMVPLNVVIGRWSAAGHFAESVKRECKVFGLCIYRLVLQRPLRLVLLHGLLEGIENRVPEAMAGAPTSDRPSRRTGAFDGYTIVGSLRGGGSGGKLYIAEPTGNGRTARLTMPERVVIKSFALTDGSSLPQIVRESRALEAARKLGLVLDHSMDDHRFWYVMPYHSGENLGIITRQMHAESSERGLTAGQLPTAMGYVRDLVETVSEYHRGGLWHKDIKPENVIINSRGAHLVDLGLVTPLRSAMTLTTHGTEYFRDPEMVRLALRGVKVHQVDGTKFDIFAIGAVLYFVLENTFPAHGGLSRFTRRSPEALRWIVRRAMAEYNKRYESVETLLADMAVVMSAADPFAVRPVDLPSMGGAAAHFDADAAAYDDDVESVEYAGSPKPPKDDSEPQVQGFAFAAGIGANGPFAKKVNSFDVDKGFHVSTSGSKTASSRPDLKVTNWWTGRYAVDFASSPQPSVVAAGSPKQALQTARDAVRTKAHEARRAAREQVREARARAREMRKRAATHRVRSTAERQPTAAVILTTLIVLGGICLVVLAIVAGARSGDSTRWTNSAAVASAPNSAAGPPLLVINDVKDTRPAVQRRLDSLEGKWRAQGYDVVSHDDEAEPVIRTLYHQWLDDPNGPADEKLEDALETFNYYGILHISQEYNGGHPNYGIDDSYVYSTRPGAKQRRRALADDARPVLLINEHPDANSDDISNWIDSRVTQRRRSGYKVFQNDVLAEAALQPYLELWKHEGADAIDDELTDALADLGYGGVLLMTEGQPDGPAGERVTELLFMTDPAGGKTTASATSGPAKRTITTTQTVTSETSASHSMLLVNDHPAKADPSIESAIRSLIDRYRRDGLEVVIDDDVEVLVRRLLPIGSAEQIEELSDSLEAVLKKHDLDGVVRIVSRPGRGDSPMHIDIERLFVSDGESTDETVVPATSATERN